MVPFKTPLPQGAVFCINLKLILMNTETQGAFVDIILIRISICIMNTKAKKKITLMLDAEVYAGLQQKVGVRKVGEYLSRLARPYVISTDIAASYQALAAADEQNQEAKEWEEGVNDTIQSENIWRL